MKDRQKTIPGNNQGTTTKPNRGKHSKTFKPTPSKTEDIRFDSKPKMDDVPRKNNWQFYAASEQIAKDIASIPFNYLNGTPFRLKSAEKGTAFEKESALPSVLTVDYSDSIGITSGGTSAINMAAVQLYTKIRQKNSGAKNYEAADVMMYVLAMRSIYSHYFQIRKILGIVNLYDYYNHNMPDTLIRSMGIDPVDLRGHISNYRGSLNLLARKINSFAVPKYFKVFMRSAFINSYIFGDSDSVRGQFYMFKNVVYYKWEGFTSATGTMLKAYKSAIYKLARAGQEVSIQTLFDELSSMIDAIFLDEDALTMSGDILKAFEGAELYKVVDTPDGFTTEILFDEDVLAQIENSVAALPSGIGDSAFDTENKRIDILNLDITQSNQLITYGPTINTTQWGNAHLCDIMTNFVFNSHKDNPDYKDCLEWSRLMCPSRINFNDGSAQVIAAPGLELVLGYTVWTIDNNRHVVGYHLGYWSPIISNKENDVYGTGTNGSYDGAIAYTLLEAFDWRPFVYYRRASRAGVSAIELGALGDYKIATLLEEPVVKKINDAAIYGAFYTE